MPDRLQGLLEPYARMTCTYGSEGAGAQQCAPATRLLSPLLANIALTALDEHLMRPWKPGGAMSTQMRRRTRVRKNLPNWRLVRYADDFVVLVRGEPGHVEEVRDEITAVLAPLGLRLSQDKTRVVDMREGFDFLGFHIKWMRKRGTNKWFVYTFIADKPVRELKRKIRALTHRQSQVDMGAVLTRINQIQRGWANYFRHAVAKHTFDRLHAFVWWRDRHDGDAPTPHDLDGPAATVQRPSRLAADRHRRDRAVHHLLGAGHPLPLERNHDPVRLADRDHRTSGMSPVESRMR